jgi:adenine-specific DNA-methyltransferase
MPTLNWLTREQDLEAADNAEYRLLAEEEKYSHGDPDTGNIIVQGDNLEALKALLPFYAGQVKCVYIDPPYNTGSAFEHYDDNMEHTIWLSMMYPRLKLLKQFLREEGAVFINLDDNEAHYCKIICDEIFGRNNFLCDIAWEKRYSPPPDTKDFGYVHDHILCYRKSQAFVRNLLPMTPDQKERYQNKDNDTRGPWKSTDYTCRFNADDRPNLYYPIIQPNTGEEIWPKKNRVWAMSKEVHEKNEKEKRIWWGKDGKNRIPALKNFLSEVNQGMMPMSLWKYTLAGHNQDAKKESMVLFSNNNAFATPKPEKLIQLVLTISTNPGDYVLDSFLGSGTTAAVAHKMGRRYIGVEMGEQAKIYCAVRLKKVIDGEQGGVSEAVGWKGGGGFRFFRLGEAVFDSERRIKPDISFENLAAHVYFTETKTPMKRRRKKSPFLGIHDGTAYALLYNGILGDKRVDGGNVLTHNTLNNIKHEIEAAEKKNGGEFEYHQMVVYGESTRLTHVSLEFNNIIFKQTPYDIKVW